MSYGRSFTAGLLLDGRDSSAKALRSDHWLVTPISFICSHGLYLDPQLVFFAVLVAFVVIDFHFVSHLVGPGCVAGGGWGGEVGQNARRNTILINQEVQSLRFRPDLTWKLLICQPDQGKPIGCWRWLETEERLVHHPRLYRQPAAWPRRLML